MASLAAFLLIGGYPVLAANNEPIALMFGQETKAAYTNLLDFAYVTPSAIFDEGKPWGFGKSDKINGWVFNPKKKGSIPPDVMLDHFILCGKAHRRPSRICHNGTFSVRVPNGPAAVHVWIGDFHLGLRRLWPNCSFRIKAGGKTVVEEKVTPRIACSQRWWLRGESEVYRKNTDTWTRLMKPVLDEYDFTVEVTNGVLALEMENVILTAMVIVPGADQATMKDILARTEQERRSQFAKQYPWKPQPDEPMPPVRTEDEKRGFILFQKNIDDDVYPWSRPTSAEITDTIRIFSARGEQETLRFGILPLKNLKTVTVEAGDFSGPDGARIETAKNADLWMERFTETGAQGTSGKGRLSGLAPLSDVLLEPRPLDYEPGIPRMYTLDLRVPKGLPAGNYRAPLIIKDEGKEIARAELFLRVLPWELEFAPVSYSFQDTLILWPDLIKEGLEDNVWRSAISNRVQFVGKYGFNFSWFSPPWGYGINSYMKWYSIKGEPGNRHFIQTPQEVAEMDWWYQLVMKEGNNAKHWLQINFNPYFWLHGGWNPGKGKGQGYGTGKETKEERALIRKDFVTIIREYNEVVKKKGYPKHYWCASGEPDNYGLVGVEEGVEMAEICQEAGVSTLCKINGPIAVKMTPPVFDIVLANHGTPITQELIDRVNSYGHQFGSHNTGETRFASGYQFWRLRGCTKFQEAIMYVDYLRPYAYLPWNYKASKVYPTESMGWRPTVRWLRYRDGRDDFMYMWNLEQRVAKAKTAGLDNTPAFKAADNFLKNMRARISVDPRVVFTQAVSAIEASGEGAMGWTGKRYERYRWLTASLIMDLDRALAGKK